MSDFDYEKLINGFTAKVGMDLLSEATQYLTEALDKIQRLQTEVKYCRNELCLKCGQYENAHLGACNGCRFKHGGEWSKDLDD